MPISVTRAQPLKLPDAPTGYDKRDQDHTRRLIELAFGQFAAAIQQTSVQVAGTKPVPQAWTPSSPIIGQIVGLGVTQPAYFQLLNPISAKKFVVIYRVAPWGPDGATTLAARWRITSQPLNLDAQGSPVSGNLMRMDETDVTAITSSFRTVNTASTINPISTLPAAIGAVVPIAGPGVGTYNRYLDVDTEIISLDAQPIVLAPGDAFEFENTDVGASRTNGLFVMFDELTGPTLTNVALNEVWRPISSIMGGVFTAAGNLATVQLLNPIISPNLLRVTGIRMLNSIAATARCFMRRTSSPLHMGGTVSVGSVRRLDGRDHAPIYGIVQGCTQPVEGTGNLYPETVSFYADRPGLTSGEGLWTGPVRPFSAPIFLRPGSAIEMQAADTSSGLYGDFIWDEVPA